MALVDTKILKNFITTSAAREMLDDSESMRKMMNVAFTSDLAAMTGMKPRRVTTDGVNTWREEHETQWTAPSSQTATQQGESQSTPNKLRRLLDQNEELEKKWRWAEKELAFKEKALNSKSKTIEKLNAELDVANILLSSSKEECHQLKALINSDSDFA